MLIYCVINSCKNLTPYSRKLCIIPRMTASQSRPSSDLSAFKQILKSKRNVAVLTGAGVSAESGVPTFRGAGGFWREYQAQHLATPEAFERDPSLVWEFYHYRRELVLTKDPNKAHVSIAKCQKVLQENNRKLTIITQNIDGLHQRAGAVGVIELHGSLFKTRCTRCSEVLVNMDSPICPALRGRGKPDIGTPSDRIPELDLPRCKKDNCRGLLRPHVVWFGEALESQILNEADAVLTDCDICLVIGTSSVVYPAAMFAPQVAMRGVPVAEFNLETTPATLQFAFHFEGPCATTVSEALDVE